MREMNATFFITEKTGYACTRIPDSSEEASTFHAYRMRLDKVTAVAEAGSIVEEAFIQANYTIVPKRTIDDFLQIHEADMARWPRKKYVEVDLPMMDEDKKQRKQKGDE